MRKILHVCYLMSLKIIAKLSVSEQRIFLHLFKKTTYPELLCPVLWCVRIQKLNPSRTYFECEGHMNFFKVWMETSNISGINVSSWIPCLDILQLSSLPCPDFINVKQINVCLLCSGFTLLYGGMFLKTWRVYRIRNEVGTINTTIQLPPPSRSSVLLSTLWSSLFDDNV